MSIALSPNITGMALYMGGDIYMLEVKSCAALEKTKRDLIAMGAVQEEAICPAVPADLIVLALDPVTEPAPESAPESAPEAAPEPVPEAAPEPAPEAAPEPVKESGPTTVTVLLGDVKVACSSTSSKEIHVKVNEEKKTVEFSF